MQKFSKIVNVEAVLFNQDAIVVDVKKTIGANGVERTKETKTFKGLDVRKDGSGEFVMYPFKTEFVKVYIDNYIVISKEGLSIVSEADFSSTYSNVEELESEELKEVKEPKKKK